MNQNFSNLVRTEIIRFWTVAYVWVHNVGSFLVRWRVLDFFFLKHPKSLKSVQKIKSYDFERILVLSGISVAGTESAS